MLFAKVVAIARKFRSKRRTMSLGRRIWAPPPIGCGLRAGPLFCWRLQEEDRDQEDIAAPRGQRTPSGQQQQPHYPVGSRVEKSLWVAAPT